MAAENLTPCGVELVENFTGTGCDIICVIDKSPVPEIGKAFELNRQFDKAFDKEISCMKISGIEAPIVYAPVGDLTDYEDVRSYQNAAAKALRRAIKVGASKPLLLVPSSHRYENVEICSILGALQELYVPIQLREDVPSKKEQVSVLKVLIPALESSLAQSVLQKALLLESGRFLARDIGVGDPERMSPPNVEKYVRGHFPSLKVTVLTDKAAFKKEYPLFEAVNRAASSVERHQGRIIFLEYKPPRKARKSLLLVGKGVTYDTGGADIKAGGVMAGMSRDKCGAAAVAGFMKIVEKQKPSDVHVVAALCLVRNSVGEECYVADEVITSRAGVRVRVGNTDAEGRMCMTDALCKMKEIALAQKLPDPHLFTIATLTGHACLAVGEGYTIAVDNSVARSAKHAELLKRIGDNIGDPFEISTLRQDDFDFNAAQVIGEDVVQSNNLPSVRTQRGHQVPVSFMIVASGLDKHGMNSETPLKYTHLDIAASAGEYPKMPTGSPIVALAKTHLE